MRAPLWARGAAAAMALLSCLVVAKGCATATPSGATVVDTPLVAYVSAVRSLHHQASLHERAKSDQEAIAALERATSLPRPAPTDRVEMDELMADTYARLAELRLRAGDPSRALVDVDRGLVYAPRDTFYRGHLYEVRGMVGEKLSAAEAGRDRDKAEVLRKQALADYERATQVHETFIRRTLVTDGGVRK